MSRWQTDRGPPVELVAVNEDETLFVSGEIEDWGVLRALAIDTVVDMEGTIDPGVPEAPDAILWNDRPAGTRPPTRASSGLSVQRGLRRVRAGAASPAGPAGDAVDRWS